MVSDEHVERLPKNKSLDIASFPSSRRNRGFPSSFQRISDGISNEVSGISNEVNGISADSTEIRRVTTQHNNRDRRDHGLEADQPPINKDDRHKCKNLWKECKAHPEWLDLKKGQRITLKPAYAALMKMGKFPKSIKSLLDFKRALDNARK